MKTQSGGHLAPSQGQPITDVMEDITNKVTMDHPIQLILIWLRFSFT